MDRMVYTALSGLKSQMSAQASIANNSFANAGAIVVSHSVGAPETTIVGNRFAGTSAPRIGKLYPQGTPRVTLRDNIGINQ